METIFSHNPTPEELFELTGRNDTSEVDYIKGRNTFILLDLALLFELRKERELAGIYWNRIPDLEQQYRLGFDDHQIPMEK